MRMTCMWEVEPHHRLPFVIIERNKKTGRVAVTLRLGETYRGNSAQVNMNVPSGELNRCPGVSEIYAFR